MVDKSRSANIQVIRDQKEKMKNGSVQIFSNIRKDGKT